MILTSIHLEGLNSRLAFDNVMQVCSYFYEMIVQQYGIWLKRYANNEPVATVVDSYLQKAQQTAVKSQAVAS